MKVYILVENNSGITEILGVYDEVGKAIEKFETVDNWSQEDLKKFKDEEYLGIESYEIFIANATVK